FLGNVGGPSFISPSTFWGAATPVGLTDAASVAPDLNTGIHFFWSVLVNNRTLANPTNKKAGQRGMIMIYNGVGGATINAWGTDYKFPGGTKPVPSTAGGAIDYLEYFVNQNLLVYCNYRNNYS